MLLVKLFFLSTAGYVAAAATAGIYNTKIYARQAVPVPNYSFEGTTGPVNWHGIEDDNALCAQGENQTPINFNPGDLDQIAAGEVDISIPSDQTPQFVNQGINVQVNIAGNTTISGKRFNLQQFHFHTPGEHRVNNEYFPVEAHLVHTAEDDPSELAVIGFLFQLTPRRNQANRGASRIFSRVIRSIDEIANPGDSTDLSIPRAVIRAFTSAIPNLSFSTYSGSLTTPPCSEGVTWLVARDPLFMTVQTFNRLKSVVKFNSRFTQGGLGEQNLLSLAADQLAALP